MTLRPITVSAVISVVLASTFVMAPAAEAKAPRCFGKKATIVSNAKKVMGTKKKDVIVSTRAGAKIYGLDGDDRICAKSKVTVDAGKGNDQVQVASGTVQGGDGNDVLVQKGAGTIRFSGGKGNDRLIAGPGSGSLSGGPGEDSVTVPDAALSRFTYSLGPEDFLDGQPFDPAQQAGAPQFRLVYGGATGDDGSAHLPNPDTISPDGDYISFSHILAAPGRTIASWTLDQGDGAGPVGGSGPPPITAFLTPLQSTIGVHTITASLTDSTGAVTTHTVRVHTGTAMAPSLSATLNGQVASFTAAVTAGASEVTSWTFDPADGSPLVSGTGPVPASFAHTYPVGDWAATLTTFDGFGHSSQTAVDVDASGGQPTLSPVVLRAALDPGSPLPFAGSDTTYQLRNLLADASPVYGWHLASVPSGSSVSVGTAVTADVAAAPSDSVSFSWGDGKTDSGAGATHVYTQPGTYTITTHDVTTGASATAPVTVSAAAAVTLTQVGVTTFAPVAFHVSGSLPEGQPWVLGFADGTVQAGTGPLPSSVTHVFPRFDDLEGDTTATSPLATLSWADAGDVGRSAGATGSVARVPRGISLRASVGFNSTSGHPYDSQQPAADPATVLVRARIAVPAGAKLASAVLNDGAGNVTRLRTSSTTGTVTALVPSLALATRGLHLLTVTARDSNGQTWSAQARVEGWRPVVPATPVTGAYAQGQTITFPLDVPLPAGQTVHSWAAQIGRRQFGGFGPPPPSVSGPADETNSFVPGTLLSFDVLMSSGERSSYSHLVPFS